MYEDTLLIVCVKWYENLRLQVEDVTSSDNKFLKYDLLHNERKSHIKKKNIY
jgi:hypothetical protein